MAINSALGQEGNTRVAIFSLPTVRLWEIIWLERMDKFSCVIVWITIITMDCQWLLEYKYVYRYHTQPDDFKSLRRGIPDSLLTLNEKEIRDSFSFWIALILMVKQYPPCLATCYRSGACH
eukprot:13749035-Ditylum_brightwellii.AAC.1